MLKLLEAAKVPVKAIKMNPQKQQPITGALQALLSKDPALKVLYNSQPCIQQSLLGLLTQALHIMYCTLLASMLQGPSI